jgi:hypothetical protein
LAARVQGQAGEVPELKPFLVRPPPLPNKSPLPNKRPVSPLSPEYRQERFRVGTLRAIWLGEYSLGQTFWGAYAAGCFGVIMAATLINAVATTFWDHRLYIGFLNRSFLLAFCSVGVWNSAKSSIKSPAWIDRFWGFAARAFVLFAVLKFIFNAVNGGAVNLLARMTGPMDIYTPIL